MLKCIFPLNAKCKRVNTINIMSEKKRRLHAMNKNILNNNISGLFKYKKLCTAGSKI